MRSTSRVVTFASGILGLLCTAIAAGAQGAPQIQPVTHIASLATGSIQGTVQDEKGLPVSGAVVSALGATTAVAVTDRGGRFELRMLTPGPYLLRAHQTGFVAPRGQIVDVRPSARASSAIAMRRAASSSPLLMAGVGTPTITVDPAPAPPDAVATTGSSSSGDDHSETAWRLRHARRSILKDVTIPEGLLTEDTPETDAFAPGGLIGRAVGSPARLATNFFGATPFSGQVNLLTLGSFDTPQQIFSPENFGRSVAYLSLGAPVGEHADWTVHAALTQGDIASWILAGEYTTRAPATHRYDLGWSYSMQRYDGGNFAALRNVAEGSRNAGALYAFDTYSVSPKITLTYGGRYAGYDYLEGHGLLSPRGSITVSPADHLRVSALLSRRAVAPGAEEFMPRIEDGVWLPPQRTFSSIVSGRPLEAEYTNHADVEVERDLATAATVSVRAFRQHVTDQLLTMFGFDVPGVPAARLGHYLIGYAGDVDATGFSAGFRTAIAQRVHGSVEYTVTRARWTTSASDDTLFALLLAPSAVRAAPERIHDVATSVETEVPETSTRVVVLYRVSNAFAAPTASSDRPALDARFDVQVRQSLPFMDFSSAKWEMLVAVRNFFHDASPDQSVYDELLVVRPPKRIVGGLTLKF
jgi:carboxypeptidase family protein/TonB-dependent receptor-like protein